MIMINGVLYGLFLFLLTAFADRDINQYLPNKYHPYKETL